MKKYRFLLKKIQQVSICEDCSSDETVEDVIKRIEKMSEDELQFSEPEYHLEAISKDEGKISKLLWLFR